MSAAPDFVTDAATEGIPAPYGRACSSCARSKCRCVWQPGGTACERCSRLKKKCQPGNPVRKRSDRPRPSEAATGAGAVSAAARTTALEQKLNDLVSLLQAKNSGIGGGDADDSSASHDAAAVLSSLGGSGISSAALGSAGTSNSSPNTSAPSSGTPAAFHPVAPDPLVSPIESDPVSLMETKAIEECFHRFRTCMLQYYPFIHIPPGTTAQGFRRHRPFLFLVIMAVTYRHSALQALLSERARDLVAQKVAREQERTLDYLLGILCFLGWKQYGRKDKASADKSVITTFCQLASGLVYDLCLHKQRTQRISLLMVFRPLYEQQRELLTEPPALTNEERRAALATFLMTSQMSVTMKRIDALRWTQQLDECLRVISDRPECAEDAILVTQVRLQLIVEQANQADWHIGQAVSGPLPGLQSAEYPPSKGLSPVLVSALRSRIGEVMSSAPPEVAQHPAIILQSTTADLFLSESTVEQPSSPTSLASDLSRLSSLERCVQCTARFFDCLLNLDAPNVVSLSFPLICNFTHNLLSLYNLSTRQEPGWDRAAVRETIDVLMVLDRLVAFMPEMSGALAVGATAGTEGDGGPLNEAFQQSMRVFGQFRELWAAELSGLPARPGAPGAPAQNGFVQNFEGMDLDLNEEWLRDVFNMP